MLSSQIPDALRSCLLLYISSVLRMATVCFNFKKLVLMSGVAWRDGALWWMRSPMRNLHRELVYPRLCESREMEKMEDGWCLWQTFQVQMKSVNIVPLCSVIVQTQQQFWVGDQSRTRDVSRRTSNWLVMEAFAQHRWTWWSHSKVQ